MFILRVEEGESRVYSPCFQRHLSKTVSSPFIFPCHSLQDRTTGALPNQPILLCVSHSQTLTSPFLLFSIPPTSVLSSTFLSLLSTLSSQPKATHLSPTETRLFGDSFNFSFRISGAAFHVCRIKSVRHSASLLNT